MGKEEIDKLRQQLIAAGQARLQAGDRVRAKAPKRRAWTVLIFFLCLIAFILALVQFNH